MMVLFILPVTMLCEIDFTDLMSSLISKDFMKEAMTMKKERIPPCHKKKEIIFSYLLKMANLKRMSLHL